MSALRVTAEALTVRTHPDADALELAQGIVRRPKALDSVDLAAALLHSALA